MKTRPAPVKMFFPRLAIALCAFAAASALAAPIPGISTVQDLINLNQGDPNDGVPQGGVVIDGIRFYDFSYTAGGTDATDASSISVQTAAAPIGNVGLEFEFNWLAADNRALVSTIRYKVEAPSGKRFSTIGVFFNGRVPPGMTGPNTVADVAQTIRNSAAQELGQLIVRNDGGDPANDTFANRLSSVPTVTSLAVTTVIRAQSDPATLALISVVDNTFGVAPTAAAVSVSTGSSVALVSLPLLLLIGSARVRARAAVLLLLATVAAAPAAPIPGVSTLQDLINLNQGSANDGVAQGGVVVSGVRFYDFAYSRTGTNAPTPAQIAVQSSNSAPRGLLFSYNWSAPANNTLLSTIRYKAHVEVGGSNVAAAAMTFSRIVSGQNARAFADANQVVRTLSGNVLGAVGLFDDAAGPGVDDGSESIGIAPSADVDLTTAIRASSGPSGATGAITEVENTFTVEADTPQSAPNFVVTTTDEHSDGVCGTEDCSLLEAINAANSNLGNNSVITFAAGVRGTITSTLQAGGMTISRPMHIVGPGASELTISGGGVARILLVASPQVRLSGLTFANGRVSGASGGAIANTSGGLLIEQSVLTNNKAVTSGINTGSGGAIFSTGPINLLNCTLTGNSAEGSFAVGGALTVTGGNSSLMIDSTVSGNSAGFAGGAVYVNGGGFQARGCTFHDNQAGQDGGAIRNTGTTSDSFLNIVNCTFARSNSTSTGGAIGNLAGGGFTALALVTNCTLAENTAPTGASINTHVNNNGIARVELANTILSRGSNTGENLNNSTGTFLSLGNNVANDSTGGDGGTGPGGFLNAGGDVRNTDPRLDTLKNNGGPTATYALLSDSPAINAGNDAKALPQDQRGVNRVGTSDIGAFEFQPQPPPPTPTPTPPPSSKLANIATRLRVETGDNVLIGGFIITGLQPKRLIVRAIGPSLNVAGAVENPELEIYRGDELIATNDNWRDATNQQEVIDSTVAPPNDSEAAILTTLDPGVYTAIMRGVGGQTGIGSVEAYDLHLDAESSFANISTRGFVQTGDDIMIGGLIVVGNASRRVLLRAIGPSLGIAGQLEDPLLELFDSNGNPISSNNNWKDTQQAEIEATTIPPSHDLESAIVAFLPPGSYTAQVRGVDDATGVALVEVYGLQ